MIFTIEQLKKERDKFNASLVWDNDRQGYFLVRKVKIGGRTREIFKFFRLVGSHYQRELITPNS